MTAINTLQTNDAIHFFSDGAYIDPSSNRMVATSPKVFTFPHARCAIGISGPMELCRSLSTVGLLCQTIDQVVGDVEAILPELIKVVLDGWPPLNFGVYIGGFSAEGEHQFYRLDAKTTDSTFKFIRCDADCWNYEPALTQSSIALVLGEDKANEFDRGFIERLEISDPVAHGTLALEAQRRIKVCDSSLSGGSAYTVGAFAQVTSVYCDRVESRILKRWPDQVGAPIIPEGAPKVYQAGFGKISYQPHQAVGFKGANDAANGIDSGASSGYVVNSTDGYVTRSADVYSTEVSTTLNENSVGWSGYTMRMIVPAGAAGNGDQLKITLTPPTGGANVVISDVFVGHPGAGSAFDGTQVRAQFSGSSGVTLTAGGAAVVSDPVAYAYDRTKSLMVAVRITSGDSRRNLSLASTYSFYAKGSSVAADASGTSPTGFGTATSGRSDLVTKVEARTTAAADMTLVTATQTTDSSVSNARVLLEYDASDSPTLNTDLTVEVTCDGGTNWTAGTLVKFSSHLQSGHHGAETGLFSCTPGTSVAARIKTANGKNVPIHALALQWE